MGDLLSRLVAFHGRSNVWRNLRTLIHKRKGLTLPISADVVSLHVRKRKSVRIIIYPNLLASFPHQELASLLLGA